MPENTPQFQEGQILVGPLFNEPMRVETIRAGGTDRWVLGLVGTRTQQFRRVTLGREEAGALQIVSGVRSYNADPRLFRLGIQAQALGIACWFIDTDYNEESFFVRQAYFLGANDPYKSLKTTLKAEINEEAWETLHSDTSRPFDKPDSGRIAVKVINHLGDEVMKVFRVK